MLQALRRANSVPIIALHNYTEDEDMIRVLNSGADLPLHRAVSPAVLEAHAWSLIKEQIYKRVWITAKEHHSSITKPIRRPRLKIEPDVANPIYICSVRGVGYQFTPMPVESCDI